VRQIVYAFESTAEIQRLVISRTWVT